MSSTELENENLKGHKWQELVLRRTCKEGQMEYYSCFFVLPVGWVSQTKDVRLRNSGVHSGLTEVDLSEDCWRR